MNIKRISCAVKERHTTNLYVCIPGNNYIDLYYSRKNRGDYTPGGHLSEFFKK